MTSAADLIAAHAPALLRYFRRRVDVPEEAADLTADTIETAWRIVRRMPSDEDEARMWLYGIARNVLRHHHRSRSRKDALTHRLRQNVRLDSHDTPVEHLDVRAAVAALPPDLAELVRLVHWDGFSIEEASRHLSVSASTLRTRHATAKRLLRDALDEPPEPADSASTRRPVGLSS